MLLYEFWDDGEDLELKVFSLSRDNVLDTSCTLCQQAIGRSFTALHRLLEDMTFAFEARRGGGLPSALPPIDTCLCGTTRRPPTSSTSPDEPPLRHRPSSVGALRGFRVRGT